MSSRWAIVKKKRPTAEKFRAYREYVQGCLLSLFSCRPALRSVRDAVVGEAPFTTVPEKVQKIS